MSGDVNETAAYFAIGLVLTLVLLSTALGFYYVAEHWLQRSYTTATDFVDGATAEEYSDFDQNLVSGSQVRAALQRYSGKDVVLLVANASMNSGISGTDAYLVGTSGGGKICAKYVRLAGTPPIEDSGTGGTSPSVKAASNYAIPILVYSKYFNKACDSAVGSLGLERVFEDGTKDKPFRLLFNSSGMTTTTDSPNALESSEVFRKTELNSTRLKAKEKLTYVSLDTYGAQCGEFITKLCKPASGSKDYQCRIFVNYGVELDLLNSTLYSDGNGYYLFNGGFVNYKGSLLRNEYYANVENEYSPEYVADSARYYATLLKDQSDHVLGIVCVQTLDSR